ncbi:MAG: ATP-binding protein [Patescibacteria group bacterium]
MIKKKQVQDIEDKFLVEKISEDISELERYIKEFSVFLPQPFCLITPAYNIVDINNALKKMIGYEESEIIGQEIGFLFKDKDKIKEFFNKLKKTAEVVNQEMEVIAKDGQTIHVTISIANRFDDHKNVVGYFLAITDISELKKLQENLEDKVKERTKKLENTQNQLLKTLEEVNHEQNKTAAIISNFIDPVIVVDRDWRIILLNPAAKNVFKLSNKDLGKKLKTKDNDTKFSFSSFASITKIKYKVNQLELDKNGMAVVEEVIIASNKINKHANVFSSKEEKNELVYKVMTAPVTDSEKINHGYMKVFYDLTREKAIDHLKSEFISIAAHQLRTPLSAIKWAIKMVFDGDAGPLNEEQKNLLFKGYKSNERVIRLVNDLLNVSRIEEGRFGYEFKKGDIEEVLNIAINNVERKIANNHVKFKLNKPAKVPLIYMDQERVLLLIQNLLDNAVKYTPEYGKIEISLKVRGGYLFVNIKDNGVGIPKSDQEKIFTKFFRGVNVVRMQTEGTGLGLFIAKNIVNKHKGTIDIKSEEGRGTEVKFSLPLNKK